MPERIPVARPDLSGNERPYVLAALEEGWIGSTGRFLERFEADFARYCGVRHALACSNGTVALHLLLLALGLGPGDEVVVPSFTYVASANAVTYTGATPVFVDSDPETWNLDPSAVAAALTPRTRAILAVHLYGHPAAMDPLRDLASTRGIALLEDAAEAHGAEVMGRRTGSLGDAATFSFFGNKILTTGEGGMVTTNDAALAARMRQLKNQGMDPARRYWFPVVGYNYRMTNVAAAIGCAQLERMDGFLAERRRIAADYDARLAPHVERLGLTLAPRAPWATRVPWLYSLLVPSTRRDALLAHLDGEGIESRPFFHPMHTLPMYRASGPLPVAERLGASGINLPTFQGLAEDQIDRICESLVRFLES